MTRNKRWSGRTVTRARAYWAARLPLPCALCGREVSRSDRWVVEHLTPKAAGGELTAVYNQGVSHRRCSDASGSRVRKAINDARTVAITKPERARGIRGV